MRTLSQSGPPCKGLAISIAIHLAGALIALQFGPALLSPPPRRAGATLIFLPPPKAASEASQQARVESPKLRPYRQPRPAPASFQPPPILTPAPVLQTPAPEPARSAVAIPALPQPPPDVRTGVLETIQPAGPSPRQTPIIQPGAFANDVRTGTKPPARTATHPAGFDAPAAAAGPARLNAVRPQQTTGFDSATSAEPPRPGARVSAGVSSFGGPGRASATDPPSRRAVVTAGSFGAMSPGGNQPPRSGLQVAGSGFGDTVAAKPSPPVGRATAAGLSTPVEITYKPRPAYTEEARRAQVEGEVVVEALFTTTGEVRVVRILRGLGHGLNENALAAVRAIRFRPATKDGQPVDATATVRIRFELAY